MGKRKRSGSFSKTDDSGAKKSDDCDSQEELDLDNASSFIRGVGSNDELPGNSQGQGSKNITFSSRRRKASPKKATRCSARVQEKQEKLRREASPSKQIVAAEVPCPLVGVCSSTSANVTKGASKHPSPTSEDPPGFHTSDSGINLPLPVGFEEKRKKRNWELWSIEDKQLFFEALNEFGKDFDAIQTYLSTKLKPRSKSSTCGQYASKNKDQVRHFYYRTWNKISKYLRFPLNMKKANQELYGLVNYGELRKKQRVLNSKSAVKLCELVDNGITSIKFRGKTCRIKTPVCRALKRLNGLEDVEHTRVPHKVGIEMIPTDGKTWRCVQNVSHNPRAKAIVTLQRTLASIILFFEDRWKRSEDRLKEQLSSVFGKPRPRLRLIPMDKREMGIPLFKVAENTSSTTICLRSYTENILCRERNEELELINPKLKRNRKQSGSRSGNVDPNFNVLPGLVTKKSDAPDYGLADCENSDVESQFNAYPAVNSDYAEKFSEEQSNATAWTKFQKKWHEEEEMYESTRNQNHDPVEHNPCTDTINPATETDNDDLDHDIDDGIDKLCACGSGKPAEPASFVSHVWDDERIKLGWTAEEAGVMTVGEVYLMLGQTEKLCFEYCWDVPEEEREEAKSLNLLNRLIATARFLKKKKTSRSKAALAHSPTSANCGSLTNCSNCGSKVEIVTNFPNQSKENPTNPNGIASTSTPTTNSKKACNPPLDTDDQHQPCSKVVPTMSTNLSPCNEPLSIVTSVLPIVAASDNVDVGNFSFVQQDGISSHVPQGRIIMSEPSPDFTSNTSNIKNGYTTEADDALKENNLKKSDAQESEGAEDRLVKSTIESNHASPSQNKVSLTNLSPVHTNYSGGLIELSSIVTNLGIQSNYETQTITPNIKATLLPPSSSMVKSASGSISVNYGTTSQVGNNVSKIGPETELKGGKGEKLQVSCIPASPDVVQVKKAPTKVNRASNVRTESNSNEQNNFRRPSLVPIAARPKELAEGPHEAPKPFLDLPKGNRRLGRRPNYKRVVVPRVLPLLPKQEDIIMHTTLPLGTILTVTTTSGGGTGSIPTSVEPATVFYPVPTPSNTPSGTPISTLPGSILPKSSVTLKKLNSNEGSSKLETKNNRQSQEQNQNPSDQSQKSTRDESRIYNEDFLGSVPGSISCSSNDFADLLKVRRQESNSNMAAGDMDSLSLSSFMEISLPESARMTANECINTDLHIDDLENSNCSLSLSNILSSGSKSLLKDLATPDPSPKKLYVASTASEGSNLPSLSSFDNPWNLESGDMSLSNLFGNYEGRGTSGLSEGDMNFQSIIGDSSLDFASKLNELASPITDNRK